MDWWDILADWFLGLGEVYGVDPIIFGSLYVGAIPFFTLSIVWLIKNLRFGRPIILPVIFSGLFFISSYLYLIIAGRNIPFWVYLVIAGLVIFGVVSTLQKIRRKTRE